MRETIPGFTSSAGTFGRCQSGTTCVNKSSAISFLVDSFKIDNKLGGVVFGEREHFGAKERNDVIGYHRGRFILEIRVVDAELRVEPVDLVGHQLARDETLVGWS
jgi:hypothetical protein